MSDAREADKVAEDSYFRDLQFRFTGRLRWLHLVFALGLGIIIYCWAENLYYLFVLLTILISTILLWISITSYVENFSEILRYRGKYSFYTYDMLSMTTLQITVLLVIRWLSSLSNPVDKAQIGWETILAIALIAVSVSLTRQMWWHSLFLLYRSDLADDIKKVIRWLEWLMEKRWKIGVLGGIALASIDTQNPQRLAGILPELLVAVTLFVSIVIVQICLNPDRQKLGIPDLLGRIPSLIKTAVVSIGLMALYLALSSSRPLGDFITEIEMVRSEQAGGSLEELVRVLFATPRALQVLAAFVIGVGVAIVLISFTRMCDSPTEAGNMSHITGNET